MFIYPPFAVALFFTPTASLSKETLALRSLPFHVATANDLPQGHNSASLRTLSALPIFSVPVFLVRN